MTWRYRYFYCEVFESHKWPFWKTKMTKLVAPSLYKSPPPPPQKKHQKTKANHCYHIIRIYKRYMYIKDRFINFRHAYHKTQVLNMSIWRKIRRIFLDCSRNVMKKNRLRHEISRTCKMMTNEKRLFDNVSVFRFTNHT